MLPLLIPIITQLAPSLVDWLFGKNAADATTKVVDVVKAVTGADPTTAEGVAVVQAMVAGKPDVALQLQSSLMALKAQMQAEADREADVARQADVDAMKASIADIANARQQTVDLAKSGSPIAYGAVIVSGLAMVTFFAVTALALFRGVPEGSQPIVLILVGTVATMPTAVLSYWLGSSAGSARKDVSLDVAHAQMAAVVSAASKAP
jgi:hypothetical protein